MGHPTALLPTMQATQPPHQPSPPQTHIPHRRLATKAVTRAPTYSVPDCARTLTSFSAQKSGLPIRLPRRIARKHQAVAAGISRANLTVLLPSKEASTNVVLDDVLNAWLAGMQDLSESTDPETALAPVTFAPSCAYSREHPAWRQSVHQRSDRWPAVPPALLTPSASVLYWQRSTHL